MTISIWSFLVIYWSVYCLWWVKAFLKLLWISRSGGWYSQDFKNSEVVIPNAEMDCFSTFDWRLTAFQVICFSKQKGNQRDLLDWMDRKSLVCWHFDVFPFYRDGLGYLCNKYSYFIYGLNKFIKASFSNPSLSLLYKYGNIKVQMKSLESSARFFLDLLKMGKEVVDFFVLGLE